MKSITVALIAIGLCASAAAAPANSIVGTHEVSMGKQDNSVTIQLACESETACTLTSEAHGPGNRAYTDKQVLRKVRPVENLTYATYALKYAIGQKDKEFKNEENSEIMKRLRPAFASNPSIEKCWDLGYPEADYMLACTLTNASPEASTVYLFGTLMANCGEAFCRYTITPMSRVK